MQTIHINYRRFKRLSIKIACDNCVLMIPAIFSQSHGIGDPAKKNSPSAVIVVSAVKTVKQTDQSFRAGGWNPIEQAAMVAEAILPALQPSQFVSVTSEYAESFRR